MTINSLTNFSFEPSSALFELLDDVAAQLGKPVEEAWAILAPVINGEQDPADLPALTDIFAQYQQDFIEGNFSKELNKLKSWGIDYTDGQFISPSVKRFAGTSHTHKSWSFDKETSKTFKIDGNPVELTGGLQAGIGFNLKNQTSTEKDSGLSMPSDDYSLVYGIDFKAKAGLGGSASSPYLSLSLSASAYLDADLDYYFQFDGSEKMFRATKNSLQAMSTSKGQFFDLTSTFSALTPPIADTTNDYNGLRTVMVSHKNGVELSGSLNAGTSTNSSIDVSVKDNIHSISASMTLGGSVGYRMKYDGTFKSTACKVAPNVVRIALSKSSATESASNFELGANIVVTGLDTFGADIIKEYLPYDEQWLKELNEWSQIGKTLQEKLTDKLTDVFADPAWKALVKSAAGVSPTALKTYINGKVKGEFKRLNGKFTDVIANGSQDIEEFAEALVLELGLTPELQAYLNLAVQDAVSRAVAQYKEEVDAKIEAKLQQLQQMTEEQVADALKPVELVGAKVTDMANGINTEVQKVTSVLKSLLSEYQAFRKKLQDGAKKAAEFELAMKFAYSKESWEKDGAMLTVELNISDDEALSDQASALYNAMMLGRVGQSFEIANTMREQGDPALVLMDGKFENWAKSLRGYKLGLSLPNLELYRARRKLSEVNLTVNAQGQLTFGTASMTFEEEVSGLGEVRKLKIFSVASIQKSAAQADTPLFGGLSFTIDDAKLESDELKQFLGSIEGPSTSNLLAKGITQRTLELYSKQAPNGADAILSLTMSLPASFYESIKELSMEKAYNIASTCYMATGLSDDPEKSAIFEHMLATHSSPISALELIKTVGEKGENNAIAYLNKYTDTTRIDRKTGSKSGLYTYLRMNSIHNAAVAFANLSVNFRKLGNKAIEFQNSDLTSGAARETAIAELQAICDDVNDAVGKMVVLRSTVAQLFNDSTATWQNVGFLSVIGNLSPEGKQSLVPVLTINKNGKSQKFVLA